MDKEIRCSPYASEAVGSTQRAIFAHGTGREQVDSHQAGASGRQLRGYQREVVRADRRQAGDGWVYLQRAGGKEQLREAAQAEAEVAQIGGGEAIADQRIGMVFGSGVAH